MTHSSRLHTRKTSKQQLLQQLRLSPDSECSGTATLSLTSAVSSSTQTVQKSTSQSKPQVLRIMTRQLTAHSQTNSRLLQMTLMSAQREVFQSASTQQSAQAPFLCPSAVRISSLRFRQWYTRFPLKRSIQTTALL